MTLAAVVLFTSLGVWQVRRHFWREGDVAEKRARMTAPPVAIDDALADPDAFAWRRVAVRGRFELADTVLFGPVPRRQEVGARVLTPLRLTGSADGAPRVLVDRGWIPQEAFDRFLPGEPGTLGPEIEIDALALELAVGAQAPGSRDARKTHVKHFEPGRARPVEKLQAQIPYPLAPVFLQATASESGGLPVAETAEPTSPVSHLTYAGIWLAVAALCAATWWENGRRRARESHA
jgi:surfeit locus 1 family protein